MTFTRRLGLGALALGFAAPFAGSPYRAPHTGLDLDAIARAIDDGSDHISARQLAAWIRDRRPGLRVIDVRAPQAFAEYAIPSAENVPIGQLARTSFTPDQTIILYSEEGAHAAQAWMMLRALGVTNAVFIPGGLADWQEDVMRPAIASLPTAEREKIVELSQFFGGSPRLDTPGAADAPQTPRRRGC